MAKKLDVLIAMFAYAGNGGVRTVLPEIALWLAKASGTMAKDERIGRVGTQVYGDIPLTMERNKVVRDAKEGGFDVIVMLDSDNAPDMYLGVDSNAQPFLDTSFNLIYERQQRGLPTVVCAPYCGPPPHPVRGGEENVYVFDIASDQTHEDGKVHGLKVEAYSRNHAAMMRGIQACAAGPTGCIMYSTDAFDLLPCHSMTDEQILEKYKSDEISSERCRQLLRMESWFWYEFTDGFQTQKASTEDVTNTREITLSGLLKFGEPVVFCNWDAWAGHGKPRMVGKPSPIKMEQVSEVFAEAVRNNVSVRDEIREIDFGVPEEIRPGTPGDGCWSEERNYAEVLGLGPDEVKKDAVLASGTWPPGNGSADYDSAPPLKSYVQDDSDVESITTQEMADMVTSAEEDAFWDEEYDDPWEEAWDPDGDETDEVSPVPIVKEKRLGAVFVNPDVSEVACGTIRRFSCELNGDQAIVVGSDVLAHAAVNDLDAQKVWHAPTSDLKAVSKLSRKIRRNSDLTVSSLVVLDAAESPLVVVEGTTPQDTVTLFKKHVKQGGSLLFVSDGPASASRAVEEFESSGGGSWNLYISDLGDGVVQFRKASKAVPRQSVKKPRKRPRKRRRRRRGG